MNLRPKNESTTNVGDSNSMNNVIHKIATTVVPFLVSIIMRIWFATCKITIHDGHRRDDIIKSGRLGIGCFWHYSLFLVLHQMRDVDSIAAMVSASKDGDYIANLAKFLSVTPIRGSRNQKGLSALRGLLKAIKDGYHLAIVADGSQGPPKIVQAGSILLASKTNSFILPMAWGASSYIAFNSWDRTALPKPFSKVDFFYGEAFEVPNKISAEELEVYRQKTEDSLNQLYDKAWSKHGIKVH